MAYEIRPALTPDEWTALLAMELVSDSETSFYLRVGDVGVFDTFGGAADIDSDDRHMAAAICLHDQRFGFTDDDVRWLRALANNHAIDLNELESWASSLSSRIAALLPPEPQ